MKKVLLFLVGLYICVSCDGQSNHTLDCTTYGNPQLTQGYEETGFSIDFVQKKYGGCGPGASMMIAIIDSSSCVPVTNCNFNIGQMNLFFSPDCSSQNSTYHNCQANRPDNAFDFYLPNTISYNGMIHLLDSIGNGNYILAYTYSTFAYSILTPSFKNIFINLGATAITSLQDSVPYIFFCKKGNAASVIELLGMNNSDTLKLNTTFACTPNSINEIDLASSIIISPNPTTGTFTIKNISSTEKSLLQIFNVLGEIVYTTTLSGVEAQTVNCNLPQGIYFVRMNDGEKSFVQKLVVE